MTLPELTEDLFRLVRDGNPSSELQYYFDLGTLADRLAIESIQSALRRDITVDSHQPIISGSIGELVDELHAWSVRLFSGESGLDRLQVRFSRVVQISQSISDACKDALEQINERI